MSKNNKRGGFTLAELLIVIAIIAILIGIAIPAFSASLRSARLAVDHSNIRAAYAVYMTADLTGAVDLNAGSSHTPATGDKYAVTMQKDGTFAVSSGASNDYVLQVTTEANECADSVGCSQAKKQDTTAKGEHKEGNKIIIFHSDADKWFLILDTTAPSVS